MLNLEFRLQKQFPQRTWRKSCRVLLTPRSVSGSVLLGLLVYWVYCVTWHQVRILTPSSTARWMALGGHPKWSCEDECNFHHQNLTTRAWKSVAYSKYALTCIYTLCDVYIYIYTIQYTQTLHPGKIVHILYREISYSGEIKIIKIGEIL